MKCGKTIDILIPNTFVATLFFQGYRYAGLPDLPFLAGAGAAFLVRLRLLLLFYSTVNILFLWDPKYDYVYDYDYDFDYDSDFDYDYDYDYYDNYDDYD